MTSYGFNHHLESLIGGNPDRKKTDLQGRYSLHFKLEISLVWPSSTKI